MLFRSLMEGGKEKKVVPLHIFRNGGRPRDDINASCNASVEKGKQITLSIITRAKRTTNVQKPNSGETEFNSC